MSASPSGPHRLVGASFMPLSMSATEPTPRNGVDPLVDHGSIMRVDE